MCSSDLKLEVEVRSGRVGPVDVTLAELLERWMEHLRSKGQIGRASCRERV